MANPRKTKFDRYANLCLRYKPGSERVLIAGLIKSLLAANPDWTPAIEATGLEEFKESLKKLTPKEITTKTGVDDAALEAAARSWPRPRPRPSSSAPSCWARTRANRPPWPWPTSSSWWASPGTPGSALYPVAEKNNSRGVCEVGVCPTWLPGLPAAERRQRPAFFGAQTPAAEPGPNLFEVLDLLENDDDDGAPGPVRSGRGFAALAAESQPHRKAAQES